MPDKSQRVAKLFIFDRSGDETEILKTIISGGVHLPRGKTVITRKRFFEIIDRISKHENLVRELIQEWCRQTKYYVNGGTEELKTKHPNPFLFQELCDPSDILEASRISSRMHNEIVGQIVFEFADEEDLSDIGTIEEVLLAPEGVNENI